MPPTLSTLPIPVAMPAPTAPWIVLLATAGAATLLPGAPRTQSSPESGSAADTARYVVLMQGNVAGSLEVWAEAGTVHSRFSFNDRGRGPDLHTRYRLGPDGVPTEVAIDGVDYLKSPVEERFSVEGEVARWHSQGERDSARVQGPAFYIPVNAPPSVLAPAVGAAGRTDSGCIALLPAGEACAARVDTTIVTVGGASRTLVLHALSGAGFTPEYVWLDADGSYFATTSGWMAVVPVGWESAVEPLAELEARARDQWFAGLADRIPERPAGPVAITGARLFDPEAGELRSGTTVIFDEGVITSVGPDPEVMVPADARRIPADGRILLPGLFDMHVHLGAVDGLLHLAAGVTSVRDLANDTDRVRALKKGFDSGDGIGPRVTLGGILDGPGPFAGPTRALVATPDEAREWVNRYADLGYDQVKIYSSIDRALVPAIVHAAHGRGLRVSGHIPVHMTAEQAVRAGFDEIQHTNMLFLNFRSDTLDTRTPVRFSEVGLHGATLDLASDSVQRFIELLEDHEVVVDPTVAIFENMFTARAGVVSPTYAAIAHRLPPQVQRGLLTGGFPSGDDERARFQAAFQRMLDMVAALHEAGVVIVPGTDAMAGFALHRELELYQEAGIDPVDVLRIATLGSARVARRDGELGSIEAGKLADMVLIDGDPTRDISALRNTVLVVKDGTLYDPAALYRAIGVREGPAPVPLVR